MQQPPIISVRRWPQGRGRWPLLRSAPCVMHAAATNHQLKPPERRHDLRARAIQRHPLGSPCAFPARPTQVGLVELPYMSFADAATLLFPSNQKGRLAVLLGHERPDLRRSRRLLKVRRRGSTRGVLKCMLRGSASPHPKPSSAAIPTARDTPARMGSTGELINEIMG